MVLTRLGEVRVRIAGENETPQRSGNRVIIHDTELRKIDVSFNKDNYCVISTFKRGDINEEWRITMTRLNPENQTKLVEMILASAKQVDAPCV